MHHGLGTVVMSGNYRCWGLDQDNLDTFVGVNFGRIAGVEGEGLGV